MGYVKKGDYLSKDPVKRANQLANLNQNKAKAGVEPRKARVRKARKSMADCKADPIGFIEAYFFIPEGRQLIKLMDWQKEILTDLFLTEPRANLAVLGQPKKSGKSTFSAAVALWYLMTKPMSEIYLLASTAGQTQLVCFDKLLKAIKMNPVLRDCCKPGKERIEYGDSFVQILAPNVAVAGLNPSLVVAEELWSWTAMEHKRAWDELTNPPTRPDENLNLVTSYAGFSEDEDSILWELYQQGMKQQQGEAEKDERFWFRWYGKELYDSVPWVKDGYLKQQERRLRTNSFKRLHCNEWASGIEVFISPEVIDFNIPDKQHRPSGRWLGGVTVGIDLGYKHDCSGLAVVGQIDERKYVLLNHKLFIPPEGGELDIQKTVEAQVEVWDSMYHIEAVYYDPYQFVRSAQLLQNRYIPMIEFPQTGDNCVKMTETLQGLLKEHRLQLYSNAEVRRHLLAANVKEGVRGYRLVKRRYSQKIDLTTAIALASQAAVDRLSPGDYGVEGRRARRGPRQEFAEADYDVLG